MPELSDTDLRIECATVLLLLCGSMAFTIKMMCDASHIGRLVQCQQNEILDKLQPFTTEEIAEATALILNNTMTNFLNLGICHRNPADDFDASPSVEKVFYSGYTNKRIQSSRHGEQIAVIVFGFFLIITLTLIALIAGPFSGGKMSYFTDKVIQAPNLHERAKMLGALFLNFLFMIIATAFITAIPGSFTGYWINTAVNDPLTCDSGKYSGFIPCKTRDICVAFANTSIHNATPPTLNDFGHKPAINGFTEHFEHDVCNADIFLYSFLSSIVAGAAVAALAGIALFPLVYHATKPQQGLLQNFANPVYGAFADDSSEDEGCAPDMEMEI